VSDIGYLAAFLGGILALFAPCCVVTLMPTFVGTALRQGRLRLPFTALVFAAGVGAVLLPVVWGVGALGHIFASYHRLSYGLVGIVLLALGLASIVGRAPAIPMPTLRVRTDARGGIVSTFLLGAVSGVVSSCCAPVLVGVIALSALSASPIGGLGLGVAYVFRMVFPLFVAALAWERWNLGERLKSRLVVLGHPVLWTDLAVVVIFVAMASMALTIAATGQSKITPDCLVEWHRWSSRLAGAGSTVLGRLPICAQVAVLLPPAGAIALAIVLPLSWGSRRVRSSASTENVQRPRS